MSEGLGSAPAVRVQTLAKRYGAVEALVGVSLEVRSGEAFGLVGANGAGKTTLIKCALDLAAPDSGTVELFGVDSRLPGSRAPLAYVPERFVPPHYLSAREFIRLVVGLGGARFDAQRASEVLEELELEADALDRPVRKLSKGMTQKLGLAATFLLERDLYVLDEPMSGLDPVARVAVKALLRRLARAGKTLFFTSHVLSDVEELCSSIAVLHRGRLLFRGAASALCERTGEPRLEGAFMRCLRDDTPLDRRAA